MKITLRILLSILCSSVFVACGHSDASKPTGKIKVEVLQLADTLSVGANAESKLMRTYMGSVEESANASLNVSLGGQVTDVFVSEGDRVSQGQEILRVDAAEAESSLAAAKAQLEQANDAYNRVKSVYDRGGVSEVKWVDVQTKLAQAQSLFDMATKQVSNHVLKAPFNGVIGELNATVGDHLLPGQTAVKVLNVDMLTVAFYVPELEVNKLSVGDTVRVECPSVDYTFDAIIQDKALVASRLSHSYKVKARMTKSEHSLLPGMNCKIRVPEPDMAGFVVPSHAVQVYQGGTCCWLAQGNQAVRVPVKSNTFVKNGVLISGGLKAGDKVIVSGYQKLYNGAEIEY